MEHTRKGTSNQEDIRKIIRGLLYRLATRRIMTISVWTPSHLNLADAPSRLASSELGQLQEQFNQLKQMGFEQTTDQPPPALSDY